LFTAILNKNSSQLYNRHISFLFRNCASNWSAPACRPQVCSSNFGWGN